MEQQQQQGKQINPKHIINEQKVYIFDLTNENVMLKSYVAQLLEEITQLKEKLGEPTKAVEPVE